MPAVRYDRVPTETRHARTTQLDQLSTPQLLRLMSAEDLRVVQAVRRQHGAITRAVRLIAQALRRGGRLLLVGAGTSGRLGVLEAAECPPTFHTDPTTVQAAMAGGRGAVFAAREGAEDDQAAGARAARRVRRRDVVVGLTASGVTPFVAGALVRAARRGAGTILVTCNPRTPVQARVRITLSTGPELLTGSTRLKAATATKLVLNMLTLGAMVRLGKTYGNLMVDVRPTSRKLQARARRIVAQAAHVTPGEAARWLRAADGRVKVAVLMARRGCSRREAQRRLGRARGWLRRALQ